MEQFDIAIMIDCHCNNKSMVRRYRVQVSRRCSPCGACSCHDDACRQSLRFLFDSYHRETSLLRVIAMTVSTPPEVNELKMYFTQITDKSKALRQVGQ